MIRAMDKARLFKNTRNGFYSREILSPVSLSCNECNGHFTPNQAHFPSAKSFQVEPRNRFNDSQQALCDARVARFVTAFPPTICLFNLEITEGFTIDVLEQFNSRDDSWIIKRRDWRKLSIKRKLKESVNVKIQNADKTLRYCYYTS